MTQHPETATTDADGQRPVGARPAPSLLRTVRAVAWSFVGLRKGSEYRRDLETIHPVHVIVVGIVGAMLLVVGLIALVHWIV